MSEMRHRMSPFEMDHGSVYLRNYLCMGGSVVGSICFLSVC